MHLQNSFTELFILSTIKYIGKIFANHNNAKYKYLSDYTFANVFYIDFIPYVFGIKASVTDYVNQSEINILFHFPPKGFIGFGNFSNTEKLDGRGVCYYNDQNVVSSNVFILPDIMCQRSSNAVIVSPNRGDYRIVYQSNSDLLNT